MKSLLTISLFCLAMNVTAACPVKRPAELPVLPDGALASEEEMYKAQLSAEKFLLQAEAYMDCQVMNRRQHETMAAQVEIFSEKYDAQMIEFQVRTNIVAEK